MTSLSVRRSSWTRSAHRNIFMALPSHRLSAMARAGVVEPTASEAGTFMPAAMPEELAATAEASPPHRTVDPDAVDEDRTIVKVVVTIVGVVVAAAIGIVPTAIGIAHGARRWTVISGVTIAGEAQTDSDIYARLRRSGGRNGCQDRAGTQCDFCQLSHVAPRTLAPSHAY